MREFSPLTFAWLRTAGAAIVLTLIAPRYEQKLTRADHGRIALYSLLGIVINGTLFLAGLNFTTVQVAAVLITTIPVFALVAAILIGQERTTVTRMAGIAMAGGGALLVVGGETFHGTSHSVLGAVMLILNCLAYALYLVLSKPTFARLGARRVVTWLFAYGAVIMLPASAWWLWHEQWTTISPRAWITLLIVIIGPVMTAYLLNAWALRHAESSFVAVYTYVQPVLATLLGAMFLGERIRGVIVIAAALIFTGVWLAGRAGTGPIAE